jgi:hypothetical protein
MRSLSSLARGFLTLSLVAGAAMAQQPPVRRPAEIRGGDRSTGLAYRAAWADATTQLVEIRRGDKQVEVRLGAAPGPRWFAIDSRDAATRTPARLDAADSAALRAALRSLHPMASPLENALSRVVNLLASWPSRLPVTGSLRDGVLRGASGSWHLSGSTSGITDICGEMNQLRGGTYPVNLIPRSFQAIVGPYPWADGDCLGRCGVGCPGDGQPNNSVYVFGQDCLNHDACVGAQGLADPDCDLIFPATFDDFLYGPSCQKDNADLVIDGQDGPLDVAAADPIDISVSLTAVPVGTRVDYWLYAQTSAGVFWLDGAGTWHAGAPVPARTGALVDVFDRPVYHGPLPPGYPVGPGTFYLSVDLVPDGVFAGRQFEDAVDVTVH